MFFSICLCFWRQRVGKRQILCVNKRVGAGGEKRERGKKTERGREGGRDFQLPAAGFDAASAVRGCIKQG